MGHPWELIQRVHWQADKGHAKKLLLGPNDKHAGAVCHHPAQDFHPSSLILRPEYELLLDIWMLECLFLVKKCYPIHPIPRLLASYCSFLLILFAAPWSFRSSSRVRARVFLYPFSSFAK